MLAPAFHHSKAEIPVIKTVASQKEGIAELFEKILYHQLHVQHTDRKYWLLAEKAFHLIQRYRMRDIDKGGLKKELEASGEKNLYQFVKKYLG